jgi:F-box-like
MEKVTQVATNVKSRRRSFTGRFLHPRRARSNSIDPNKASPALPLELIEKIIAYLNQFDLVKVSRVSRDCYTICEKYLYFRPFTRRYDKLLRTLHKYPYKGEMIIELALGLETDFWAVKYLPLSRAILMSQATPLRSRVGVY